MAQETHARLAKLGYTLPAPPKAGGNYVPAKTVGRMVYLAGVISIIDGAFVTGTVGAGRTIEEGYEAARACALSQLAVLKVHLGTLDAVRQIVGVNGYVNAVPGFDALIKFGQMVPTRYPQRIPMTATITPG